MSMIRVLFCTLLAAWAVLPLRADDRGRALVRSLSAKIASYASYEVFNWCYEARGSYAVVIVEP